MRDAYPTDSTFLHFVTSLLNKEKDTNKQTNIIIK